MSKKTNKKKALKITGIILGVIVVLVCINMLANTIVNNNNIEFAKSFDAVKNENVVIPEKIVMVTGLLQLTVN